MPQIAAIQHPYAGPITLRASYATLRSSRRRKLLRSDMTEPLAKFPLLFTRQWRARGLDAAIAALNITALASEHHGFRASAPRRLPPGKTYFVGAFAIDPGRRRQQSSRGSGLGALRSRCTLAMAWRRLGSATRLSGSAQSPTERCRNWQDRPAGVTDGGQLVVVELKVDGDGGSRSDAPPAALMEALRYAAILQANQLVIASEARTRDLCSRDER
jgi:hypothetical protein